MPLVSDQLLALAAISLRARQQQRPTPLEVWLSLDQRTRCLLNSGWVLDRIAALVLITSLDGCSPDEVADEIWQREVIDFPHPDPARAGWISRWTDILRGARPCPHGDNHPEYGAGLELSLRRVLEPLDVVIDDGQTDAHSAYYLGHTVRHWNYAGRDV
jgi:hypothetical protein